MPFRVTDKTTREASEAGKTVQHDPANPLQFAHSIPTPRFSPPRVPRLRGIE